MSKTYSVIFSGEVKEGLQRSIVQKKLAILLKKDEKIIAKLFDGKPKVVKKDIDLATCEKIQKTFLSVGALCTIENSSRAEKPKRPTQERTSESTPPKKDEGSPAEETQKLKDTKSKLSGLGEKLAEKTGGATDKIISAKQEISQLSKKSSKQIKEARSSMQYDLNTGGYEQLLKNRYFHYSLGACAVLLMLLIAIFSYDYNPMPLSRQNLGILSKHIDFIEQSFTIEGLAKSTKNRKEYLEYLLVEPIEKAGYDFADTLNSLVEEYLDDDLKQEDKKLIRKYLHTAANEREKLLQEGYIGKGLKKKLLKVSESINKKK